MNKWIFPIESVHWTNTSAGRCIGPFDSYLRNAASSISWMAQLSLVWMKPWRTSSSAKRWGVSEFLEIMQLSCLFMLSCKQNRHSFLPLHRSQELPQISEVSGDSDDRPFSPCPPSHTAWRGSSCSPRPHSPAGPCSRPGTVGRAASSCCPEAGRERRLR